MKYERRQRRGSILERNGEGRMSVGGKGKGKGKVRARARARGRGSGD